MEKRVLFAALLSALFLAWYSAIVGKWVAPAGGRGDAASIAAERSVHPAGAAPAAASLALQPIEQEDIVFIESNELRLGVGSSSGAIRSVALKRFAKDSGDERVSFEGPGAVVLPQIPGVAGWSVVEKSALSVSLRADQVDKYYHIIYQLDVGNPLVHIVLTGSHAENIDLGVVHSWSRSGGLDSRQNPIEAVALMERDSGKALHKRQIAPWRGQKVLRGTTMVSLSERYFCQTIRNTSGRTDVWLDGSSNDGILALTKAEQTAGASGLIERRLSVYFGPRDYFYLQRAGLGKAFPIGALGQIGLVLLAILNWVAKLTRNYGVAIIILSAGVTAAMAPFTLMGYRSMKKMQELKPMADRITQQYKGNQAKINEEMMALYKQHRVSPIGGCLPMLLQVPVFIALFQAISHFIELRGQRFLWIADLSLPDRAWKLPFGLPFLGEWVNALPILTAAAMYFQTKASQPSSSLETNPTAKMMSGPLMPILFSVMFYHLPSGLILYWLTNSLMGIALYRVSRG